MMLRLCAAGVLDGVACKVLVEPRVNRVDAAAFVLTDVTAKLVDSVVFVLAAVVRVGVFRRLKWSVQVGLGVNPFQEDFQGRCGHRLDRSVYLLGDQVNWFDGRRALR